MNKACPIVLRKKKDQYEFLAFDHPQDGNQIVKGTIEHGESLESACERELFEESGLVGRAVFFLGQWEAGYEGQTWGFYEMTLHTEPPETWTHYCLDDNGYEFRFFWQALGSHLDDSWHPLFQGAVEFVRVSLNNRCRSK